MGLTAHAITSRNPAQLSRDFLDDLLAAYPRRDFQVRFWDQSTWHFQAGPRFTLVLKHPGALREMFGSASELGLAQAYICNDFDIEGDMQAALDLADYLLVHGHRTLRENLRLVAMLPKLPAEHQSRPERQQAGLVGPVHSKDRDRQAIRYHYDLPVDFFSLWLDERMQYSSAYFATEDINLDRAQHAKLDYICRKLRLHPGERLLDIGCGWGGLLVHAASHYGVQAVGITLSVPQAEFARQCLRDSGLHDRCRVEVCDYRDLESEQAFDKVASI